jgi:twinkle protein
MLMLMHRTVPWDWLCRRLKIRSIKNKANQRLTPAGGQWGFFGWHTVPADAKEIVITEGEFDAMAVYQVPHPPQRTSRTTITPRFYNESAALL